ncbi:aldose 1-epimerase family protein [Brachybacterium huguangmaarense]
MALTIPLHASLFTEAPTTVCRDDEWTVTASRTGRGVAVLTVANSRGEIELLPFMGQIIWGARFDGIDLRMQNMFDEPRPATEIVDTYGCFAFHAGLLASGCPAPEDTHPLHGEFPCMELDRAEVTIGDDRLTVTSTGEYVQGFGAHYTASPSLTMHAGRGTFDIALSVTNLSAYAPMPLQYMCHMNYAFVPGATMSQSLPAGTFRLRETVPAHVVPTPRWEELNRRILAGELDPDSLEGAEEFDPEIVYFADDLPSYGDHAEFVMHAPEGHRFITRFSTRELSSATRWILHNPDQKVAAFALPATSRPEGRLAAERAGTLIMLPAGETRRFHVRTGLLAPGEDIQKENDAR